MGVSKAFAGKYNLYALLPGKYLDIARELGQYPDMAREQGKYPDIAKEGGFQLSFDPPFDPTFHL